MTVVLICCCWARVRAEVVAAQPPYGVLRTLDLPPVHLHFVYLWALPMRILQMFLQIDVFTDLFGRKLRHGRSRKRRSERGPHHAKGTRYVGELQIWPPGWTHDPCKI